MRTALMEPAPSDDTKKRPDWGRIWAEVFRKANEMMNEERK